MIKTRVPASIDEKNHQRIKDLIKTHPELNYKKISRFVNESLEEKLNKIDNELMAKRIKNAGIESFVADQKKTNRENSKKIEELEKKLKRQTAMTDYREASEALKRPDIPKLHIHYWKDIKTKARTDLIEIIKEDPKFLESKGVTKENYMKIIKEFENE